MKPFDCLSVKKQSKVNLVKKYCPYYIYIIVVVLQEMTTTTNTNNKLLYILPIFVLFFFIVLKYDGLMINHIIIVEIVIAVYVVAFYSYLDPWIGLIAFSIVVVWFLYRMFHQRVHYNIAKLNAATIPGQSSLVNLHTLSDSLSLRLHESSQIPKIIIQTGPANYSSKYKPHIQSIQNLNPDFQYMFFNDENIVHFFKTHYPEYYDTYQSLPVLIQRIDFFRYVAIYHYGGIYLDLDMTGLKSFDDEFLNHSCVFPVDEYIFKSMAKWSRYHPFLKEGCPFLLGQYAFAAEPRHPFLLHLINNIHLNLDNILYENANKKKKKKHEREVFVYTTTGPDYVTQCFMNYWNKSQIYILDCGVRQHLGIYAKHQYFGSWK